MWFAQKSPLCQGWVMGVLPAIACIGHDDMTPTDYCGGPVQPDSLTARTWQGARGHDTKEQAIREHGPIAKRPPIRGSGGSSRRPY